MDGETARTRCQETRNSYAATRRYKDAFWALQMAYNEGRQWGSIQEMSGNVGVELLKGVADLCGNGPLRLTINEIGSRTAKAASMTSPQQLGATVYGPGQCVDTYTRTASRVLAAVLERIGANDCSALEYIRTANRERYVIGSAGVREELRAVGPGSVVAPARGRRKEKRLRSYEIDWAPIMPWEVIRSPAGKTEHMARDEDTVGHEKPRTVAWMAEHYGKTIETETRHGQVVHFLDEIRHIESGPGHGNLMTEAKARAVLAEEFWLTDPAETARIYAETGLRVRWPWMFFGYIDPSKGDELQPVTSIGPKGDGLLANPFNGLGLKFLHNHVAVEAMWGTGDPWKLMQAQDFSNIAYSWIAMSLNQSLAKWRYEKVSLESGKVDKILNNDPNQGIPWTREGQWTTPPDRVPGQPFPQTAMEVANMGPAIMDRGSQISPVQQGIGPRRDGSGVALKTLLQEADTVPEDRITTDEGTIGALLRDTLIDTIRHATLGQLQRLTGGRVAETYLRMLKRDDPRHRIRSVKLSPTTMRPRTRQQTEARYVAHAESGFLPADQAVREAIEAGVTGLNTDQERAYALQDAEIEVMREAGQVEVLRGDEHAWHIERIRRELNSPDRLDFPPEYIAALQMHELAHQFALQQTAGMALGQPEPIGPEPANRPSPPAQTGAGMGSQAAGAAAPAIQTA